MPNPVQVLVFQAWQEGICYSVLHGLCPFAACADLRLSKLRLQVSSLRPAVALRHICQLDIRFYHKM